MNNLAIGDIVEVLAVPEPVTRDRDKFPETYDLLATAIGRSYAIRSINEHSMAEIWLNDDASEDTRGIHHSLWIEPEYLRKIAR